MRRRQSENIGQQANQKVDVCAKLIHQQLPDTLQSTGVASFRQEHTQVIKCR
jgi:hypothetical protein